MLIIIWIFGLIIIIAIILLLKLYSRSKKSKIIDSLRKKWGSPKDDEVFDFDAIEQYFLNTYNKNQAFHIISEQSKNDLDLNDIFKLIDRTSSKMGQQYLYYLKSAGIFYCKAV